MARRRRFPLATLLSIALGLFAWHTPPAGAVGADLPSSLTNQQFWSLVDELSEPGGVFGSDNLLSNEMSFASLVPALAARPSPSAVYLGVGPEQNFTYIAAMKPRMAFITDIRRGNLHLQLMYKALFEMSVDRAEFVSRLFTKPRPSGLTASSTVIELMNAYWDVYSSDEAAFAANLQAIQDHLTKTRGLPLPPDDLAGIARVYRAFYWYGPGMTYLADTSLRMQSTPAEAGILPIIAFHTYRDLMSQVDEEGYGLSYLASEARFAFLKDLERRNLIVPVVGDFSGPKALRAIGTYVRKQRATVGAFYVSNVESYLRREEKWSAFCANVAALPLSAVSVFIRPWGSGISGGNRNADGTVRSVSYRPAGGSGLLTPISSEVKGCGAPGKTAQPLVW